MTSYSQRNGLLLNLTGPWLQHPPVGTPLFTVASLLISYVVVACGTIRDGNSVHRPPAPGRWGSNLQSEWFSRRLV